MSICKVQKIEVLRGYRMMVTTVDGVILTTPPTRSAARFDAPAQARFANVISEMAGEFWAAITLDDDGYLRTLEGVEF